MSIFGKILGGLGSIAGLLPGIGTILGPILGGAGSLIEGVGAEKDSSRSRALQELALKSGQGAVDFSTDQFNQASDRVNPLRDMLAQMFSGGPPVDNSNPFSSAIGPAPQAPQAPQVPVAGGNAGSPVAPSIAGPSPQDRMSFLDGRFRPPAGDGGAILGGNPMIQALMQNLQQAQPDRFGREA